MSVRKSRCQSRRGRRRQRWISSWELNPPTQDLQTVVWFMMERGNESVRNGATRRVIRATNLHGAHPMMGAQDFDERQIALDQLLPYVFGVRELHFSYDDGVVEIQQSIGNGAALRAILTIADHRGAQESLAVDRAQNVLNAPLVVQSNLLLTSAPRGARHYTGVQVDPRGERLEGHRRD